MDHGNDVVLLALALELPLRIAFAASAASPQDAGEDDSLHEDDAWMIELLAPASHGGKPLTSCLVCPVLLPDASSPPPQRSYQLQFFAPACLDALVCLRIRLCSGGLIRGEGAVPLRLQRSCVVCLDADTPPTAAADHSATVLPFGGSATLPVILRQRHAGVALPTSPVLLRAPFACAFIPAVQPQPNASVEALTGLALGSDDVSTGAKLLQCLPAPTLLSAAVFEASAPSPAAAAPLLYDHHAMELHLTCGGLALDATAAASSRNGSAPAGVYTLLCALACGNGSLLTPLHVCGAVAVPAGGETPVCEWGPTLKFAVTRSGGVGGANIHVQADTHLLWYMCESGGATPPRVVAFAYLRPFHSDGSFRFETACQARDVPYASTRNAMDIMCDAAAVCGSDLNLDVLMYVGTPALTPVDAYTHSHMFTHTPALTRVAGDVVNSDGLEALVPPHLRLCTPHVDQPRQAWHVLSRARMHVHLHVRTLARDVRCVPLPAAPALPSLVASLMYGLPSICASIEALKTVVDVVRDGVRSFVRLEAASRSHTLALMEPFQPETAATAAEVILQHAISGRGRSEASTVPLLHLTLAISHIAPVSHIHAPVQSHVLEALYGRVTAQAYTPGVVPPGVLASALTLLETVAHTALALASTATLMGPSNARICDRLVVACAVHVARLCATVTAAAATGDALFGVSRGHVDAATDVLSQSHAFADDPNSAVAATVARTATLLCLHVALIHARRDGSTPEHDAVMATSVNAACDALRVCATGVPGVHATVIRDCIATVAATWSDASQRPALFDDFNSSITYPLTVTDVGAALRVWLQVAQSRRAQVVIASTLATRVHTLSRSCATGAVEVVCDAVALRLRQVVARVHALLRPIADPSFDTFTARICLQELADAVSTPHALSAASSVPLAHLLADSIIAMTVAFDRLAQLLKKRGAVEDDRDDAPTEGRANVALISAVAVALTSLTFTVSRSLVRAFAGRAPVAGDAPTLRSCVSALLQCHTVMCAWAFTSSHTHVAAGAAVTTRILDRLATGAQRDNTLLHLFGVQVHDAGVTVAPWGLFEALTCSRIVTSLQATGGATVTDVLIEAFRAVSLSVAALLRVGDTANVEECMSTWGATGSLMHVDATVTPPPVVQLGVCDGNGVALMALCAAATRCRIAEVALNVAPWSPARCAETAVAQLEAIATGAAASRSQRAGDDRFPHTCTLHSATTLALCVAVEARSAGRAVLDLLHVAALRWSCEALGVHAGRAVPPHVATYVRDALCTALRMALDDPRTRALGGTHPHVAPSLSDCIATCQRGGDDGVDLVTALRGQPTLTALWAAFSRCVAAKDARRSHRALDAIVAAAGWGRVTPHVAAHSLSRLDLHVDATALTHAFAATGCLHMQALDGVKLGDATGMTATLTHLVALCDAVAATVTACVCDGATGASLTLCQALLAHVHMHVATPVAAALARSTSHHHATLAPRPDSKRAGTQRAIVTPVATPQALDETAADIATGAAAVAAALCDATRFTYTLLQAYSEPFHPSSATVFTTLHTTLARSVRSDDGHPTLHVCSATGVTLPDAFYRSLTALAPTLTHEAGIVAPPLPVAHFAVAHVYEDDCATGVRLRATWYVLRASAELSVEGVVQALRESNPVALVLAGDAHTTLLALPTDDAANVVWDMGTPHVGRYTLAGTGRTAAYARLCNVGEAAAGRRIVHVPPCRHNVAPAHTLLVYGAIYGGCCLDGRTHVGSAGPPVALSFPSALHLHRSPYDLFHVWMQRNATVTVSATGAPPHVVARHATSSLGPATLNDKYRLSGPDPDTLLAATGDSACLRVDIVVAAATGVTGVARIPLTLPTTATVATAVNVVPTSTVAATVAWAAATRSRLASTLRWTHAVQVDVPHAAQRQPQAIPPRNVPVAEEVHVDDFKSGAPLLPVAQAAGVAPLVAEALDVATVIQRLATASTRRRSSVAPPVDMGVFGAGVGRRPSDSLPVGSNSAPAGRRVSVHMEALGLAVGRLYGLSESEEGSDEEGRPTLQLQLPDASSVVSDAHTFKSEEELGPTPHRRRDSDVSVGAFNAGRRAGRAGGHALGRVATFRSMAVAGRDETVDTPHVGTPHSPARPRMRTLTRAVSTTALALRDDATGATVALPVDSSVWLHTPMAEPFRTAVGAELHRDKADFKPSLDIATLSVAEARSATDSAAGRAVSNVVQLDDFISRWPRPPDVPPGRMAALTTLTDAVPPPVARFVSHARATGVLFAAISDAVAAATSTPCGMRAGRQALVDYADIKALHGQLSVTEQKRAFLREQRSRGTDEDMPPFADMLDRRPHPHALACEAGLAALLHVLLNAVHAHAQLTEGGQDMPAYAQLQAGAITDAVNGLFAGEEM